MSTFFIQLVNMSITASWLILAVLLFRILWNKIPKYVTIFVWLLLFIRCICPYSFKSIFSIIPSTQTIPKDFFSNVIPYIQSNISFVDTLINSLLYENVVYNSYNVISSIEMGVYFITFIWLLGMIILGIYSIYSILKLKEKTKVSLYYKDHVYYCEDIETPFIYGFRKPNIYLPIDIEENQIKYVLMHEQLHIKRKDYIWKSIGLVLLILYWFNPLMWIAYYLFNKDIEMSIDELVVKNMTVQEKKEYCESLVSLSNKEKKLLFHTLAFGETNVGQRIKNIVKYKKPTILKYLLTISSCIILVLTCMSNPIQSKDSLQGTFIKDIADWDDYSTIFQDIETIEIGDEDISYTTIFSDDVNNILKTISDIRVVDKPISHNRTLERDKTYYLILQSDTKTYFYFSHDFKEMWINREDKPSLSYRILNYERLYSLFDSFTSVVNGIDDIDVTIMDIKERWVVQSTLENKGIYEVEIPEGCSNLEIGDHIRIFYKKKYNDSILKNDEIRTIYYVNDVEIVKNISDSKLYTFNELEEAMDKVILNTPQLHEYSYVELYYDENEAKLFMDEYSVDNNNTIVIFANLKASNSIKDDMSKMDATASFVIGPNTYMSFFNTK